MHLKETDRLDEADRGDISVVVIIVEADQMYLISVARLDKADRRDIRVVVLIDVADQI